MLTLTRQTPPPPGSLRVRVAGPCLSRAARLRAGAACGPLPFTGAGTPDNYARRGAGKGVARSASTGGE